MCATIDRMALTKLNCAFRKGGRTPMDATSCSLFNPQMRPGCLAFGASAAARDSIGGQVASKLALEHFVEGISDFFHPSSPEGRARDPEIVTAENLQSIEAAFKRANSSVYSFGHKLAAGGRMAAELLGVVLQENVVSVGRVGAAGAYLCRMSELYPFFETPQEESSESGSPFIGMASLVSVQLSSVRLEEGDVLLFFSNALRDAEMNPVFAIMDEISGGRAVSCDEWLEGVSAPVFSGEFGAVIQVGPDVIFLDEECV